jgi:transposase-like protein
MGASAETLRKWVREAEVDRGEERTIVHPEGGDEFVAREHDPLLRR